MAKKSWREKRDCEKSFKIKVIEKAFAGIPEGSRMLILSPPYIDEYLRKIPFGLGLRVCEMRDDLAISFGADKTCPVSTGIFLRIVAEAALEDLNQEQSIEEISPFWRVVEPNSKLAAKLSCGVDFIREQRKREGISEL